jgi:hypothetical protein
MFEGESPIRCSSCTTTCYPGGLNGGTARAARYPAPSDRELAFSSSCMYRDGIKRRAARREESPFASVLVGEGASTSTSASLPPGPEICAGSGRGCAAAHDNVAHKSVTTCLTSL